MLALKKINTQLIIIEKHHIIWIVGFRIAAVCFLAIEESPGSKRIECQVTPGGLILGKVQQKTNYRIVDAGKGEKVG